MIIVSELTGFQAKAETALKALLRDKGLEVNEREVLVGTVPFLSPNSQAALHISANNVELWLSEDEATLWYTEVMIGSNESHSIRQIHFSVP
ncbi:MAG: hypothetical protein ABI664_13975 [bacterium]